MNKYTKIIVLFLAACSVTNVAFAQINWRKPDESIIVMTRARLDSLLTGIAISTKALLEQREQERLSRLKSQVSMMSAYQKPKRNQMTPYYNRQMTRNYGQNDARIFQELDRINQRIDQLMMEMSSQSNYPQDSKTIVVPNSGGRSPNIIYRRPVVPNRFRYSRNTATRLQENLSTEIKKLQNKIEALQTEITDLEGIPDSTNNKKISRLKERIDRLNTQLEEVNRIIESGTPQGINGRNSLIAVLKNYRQAIYFANDSANLNSAAKALLSQLAQLLKRSDKPVTIFVQGYASKTGSAMYNYKLSLRRANAVKDVLTNYGISAGKIEILGHGVNKSHSAPAARKVEISLLIAEVMQ